jgi:hypothetical protein
MKITIYFLLLILLATSVSAAVQHYYAIDIIYNNGEISYSNLHIELSQTELKTPEGTYIAEVVSTENKILNTTFFAIPLTIIYDNANPETGEIVSGGVIELNESEITLYIPYYDNAQEINIYDWDLNKKLSINVSSYVKEAAEVVEEEFIPKEVEGVPEVVPETATEKGLSYVLVAIALVIFLIFAIIVIKRKLEKR